MNFNCRVFSFYHDFEFSIFIFYFSDFQQVMFYFDALCPVHSVFLLRICVCYIEQMPIICRFCLFFFCLLHFNLVLVVFIIFIVYCLKMGFKISRMYFLCYLVIFNIKKFAFLRNSALLCVVIVVITVYPDVLRDITILQLSLL